MNTSFTDIHWHVDVTVSKGEEISHSGRTIQSNAPKLFHKESCGLLLAPCRCKRSSGGKSSRCHLCYRKALRKIPGGGESSYCSLSLIHIRKRPNGANTHIICVTHTVGERHTCLLCFKWARDRVEQNRIMSSVFQLCKRTSGTK